MTDIHLAHPGWLWLMVLAPLPWLLERSRPRIAWPGFEGFPPHRRLGWVWLRTVPALCRGLAIAALAVALAQPQKVGGEIRIAGQGVAIVVALDQSSSMKAVDFPADGGTGMISRLEAAKRTFIHFVQGRPDDLIGLVAFANYPDLLPPSPNHAVLIERVQALRPARPLDDGTNIGNAIVWGLEALLEAAPKKKVLVLLTDGNNDPAGPAADPEWAATLVRDWGVVLHTIAIGRPGGVVQGVEPKTQLPFLAEVAGPNLPLLERLAELTGGVCFAASDTEGLAAIFRRIDELEKSPIRGRKLTRYDEHYGVWAGLAMALLILDRLLALGRLRRLP